jgi:DNA-directed RNA polymerase subunit beta'
MKSTEEILELEKTLVKFENLNSSFDYFKITVASPKRMKSWAERKLPTGEIVGEVLKGETINFRTHQPELNGLFCEKIFGPIKNWKCKCGKYNGFILDKICDECNVEIIEARVRRYRMGYIELTCPVIHLWYLKGIPNYLCILLRCFNEKLSVANIEQIIYFKEGERILDPDNPLYPFFYLDDQIDKNVFQKFFLTDLYSKNLEATELTEDISYRKSLTKFYSSGKFLKSSRIQRRLGAEIIKAALESLNIKEEIRKARSLVNQISLRTLTRSWVPDKPLIRRIRILESFFSTKINPTWMILTILPVLPPNLRPLLELESGRLVAADVNEIYRLIITRNQRLFDFIYNFIAPDLITVHGRRLLQEGVDSLIDNSRLPKEKTFSLNNKALKSLTEILEGKQGRFRQSLLGKRVDYSGRSVIIVGPILRLNQCGLPYEMAVELFQPFLINELLKTKIKPPSHNTKLAHVIIKKNKPFIWKLLSSLTQKYCILLNRAPTLHRFGIQAFNPVLVLGQAIHLHPLVCTGFNADFDGDQMAVHLPLYDSSQLETRTLMRPSYNVLSPSNGDVILKPTQDMVIGSYYLTLMIKKYRFFRYKWFMNEKEALLAFYQKKILLQVPILVRYDLAKIEIKLKNGKLTFIDKEYSFSITKKDILFLKIFKCCINQRIENEKILKQLKYYVITNIGLIVLKEDFNEKLFIANLFLETSVGRLIFSMNFKNSFNKLL